MSPPVEAIRVLQGAELLHRVRGCLLERVQALQIGFGAPAVADLAARLWVMLDELDGVDAAVLQLAESQLIRTCASLSAGLQYREGRVFGALHRDDGRSFEHYIQEDLCPLIAREPLLLARLAYRTACLIKNAQLVDHRVRVDRALLEERLGPLGRLLKIRSSEADSHNGGQIPLLLLFEGGEVVYKSRSLFGEALWGRVAECLRGYGGQVRAGWAVERDGYGWMECIVRAPCSEPSEFYRRLGELSYTLFRLGGTDFHCENIVAAGNWPVPVDLETLLSPAKGTWLTNTILSTEIPRRLYEKGDVDMSTIGAANQLNVVRTARRLQDWGSSPTVGSVEYRSDPVAAPYSADGTQVSPDIDAYCDGIEPGAAALEAARPDVCDILRRELNGGGSVRVVLRNTSLYTKVLDWLSHPEQLGKATSELGDVINDLLKVDQEEFGRGIVQAEVRALIMGDVPYFSCDSTDRSLSWSEGRIPQFFRGSPIDNAIAGVLGASVDDSRRQTHAVRLAEVPPADPALVGDAAFEVQVRTMSRRIPSIGLDLWLTSEVERALQSVWTVEGSPKWLSVNDGRLQYQSPTWYDGVEGTVAGLLACGPVLSSDQRERLEHIVHGLAECGAGSPWSTYFGVHYGRLSSTRPYESNRATTSGADRVGGAADELIGLEILARSGISGPDERADALLVELRDRQFTDGPRRGGWASHDGRVLGGLSHGASGVLRAVAATARRRPLHTEEVDAVRDALAFERRLWDNLAGGWRDLRASGPGPWMSSWCHGAAGIGLARLSLLQHASDWPTALIDEMTTDVEWAVRATDTVYTSENLCCGEMGRTLFLFEAQRAGFRVAKLNSRIDRLTQQVVGCRSSVFTASLMKGDPGLWAGLAHLHLGSRLLTDLCIL